MLRLEGICKRFGSLVANDDISLTVRRGEVLALLGENGAGKSTLMNILFGHYMADRGVIRVDGAVLPPGNPAAALAAGIGMVHQHFALADNLGVLENIMVGTEPWWRPWSERRQARQTVETLSARFGLRVDPEARIADLSVGEKQRVEILKALYRGARILILDEPTAVLTPQESDSLFATLKQLVAEGLSVVFISHKLDEVMKVADRVVVLRLGRVVAAANAGDVNAGMLARWMVGRDIRMPQRAASAAASTDPTHPGNAPPDEQTMTPAPSGHDTQAIGARHTHRPDHPDRPDAGRALELRQLQSQGHSQPGHSNGARRQSLQAISLDVRAGEIVGIAGVSGNGQTLLADVLAGMTPLDAGEIVIDGHALQAHRPDSAERVRQLHRHGLAVVPEDRRGVGTLADLPVWQNSLGRAWREPRFRRWGWMQAGAARSHARQLVERFDIRLRDIEQSVRLLSGGNMQKLVLGRTLATRPRYLVASQPTWGLDVGAVAAVHQALLDAASQGMGILLISDDFDELMVLCDRIAVMSGGRVSPALPTGQWTPEALGQAIGGAHAA